MTEETDAPVTEEVATEPMYALPFSLAQALVDYLSNKPYRESAQFIQALVSLEEV